MGLIYDTRESPYCCGLREIGMLGFDGNSSPSGWLPEQGTIATTIPVQANAIRQLEIDGFKPVGRFHGNGENIITLWLRIPPDRAVAEGRRHAT